MSQPGVVAKFTLACPQCGEIAVASKAHIGKRGRCAICHTVFPIESPDGAMQWPVDAAGRHTPSISSSASQWDEVGLAAATVPAASPLASLADEYLNKARADKGRAIEQEESDASYRFVTSYGSVIGGISTIMIGTLLAFACLLLLGSIKLCVAAVFMVAAGIGWLVQGLNYIAYYRWKDQGGRG